MTTLNTVQDLAIQLMSKTFKVKAKGWTYDLSALDIGYYFEFNNRKRAFGVCNYVKKVINLSQPLCEANLDKLDTQITDTILHEIAHAFCVHIYGTQLGRGHDWRWKSIAVQIGCNGERCYDIHEVNHTQSKYTYVCKKCGRETPRHKKPKRLQACGKCCNQYNFGKFSHDYVLELRVNY